MSLPLITDFTSKIQIFDYCFEFLTQSWLSRMSAESRKSGQLSSGVRTLSLSFTSPSKQRKRDSVLSILWKVENSKFVIWQISWIQWKRILFILLIYGDRKMWYNEVKKIFEMKIRREGEIFPLYFCQFFLSIYHRSHEEIVLLNQTLIHSASTLFKAWYPTIDFFQLQRANSSQFNLNQRIKVWPLGFCGTEHIVPISARLFPLSGETFAIISR